MAWGPGEAAQCPLVPCPVGEGSRPARPGAAAAGGGALCKTFALKWCGCAGAASRLQHRIRRGSRAGRRGDGPAGSAAPADAQGRGGSPGPCPPCAGRAGALRGAPLSPGADARPGPGRAAAGGIQHRGQRHVERGRRLGGRLGLLQGSRASMPPGTAQGRKPTEPARPPARRPSPQRLPRQGPFPGPEDGGGAGGGLAGGRIPAPGTAAAQLRIPAGGGGGGGFGCAAAAGAPRDKNSRPCAPRGTLPALPGGPPSVRRRLTLAGPPVAVLAVRQVVQHGGRRCWPVPRRRRAWLAWAASPRRLCRGCFASCAAAVQSRPRRRCRRRRRPLSASPSSRIQQASLGGAAGPARRRGEERATGRSPPPRAAQL